MELNKDRNAFIDDVGKRLIENAKQAIATDKSNPRRDIIIEEAMNAMYRHFETYSEEDLHCLNIQREIFLVEKLLRTEFLPIRTEPIYDEDFEVSLPTTIKSKDDATKFLDYIIHDTRKMISKSKDLKNDSLEQLCIGTASYLERISSELGLDVIGFGVDKELKYGFFHHFSIIRIPFDDGTFKNYIADCTYRQFFIKSNSYLNRIAVVRGRVKGCSVGRYMMMTKRRREIAEIILSKGYIEVTPEVIKEYFDAIIFSGRDKTYYDKLGLDYTNPDDVIPEYTPEEYLQTLITNCVSKNRSIQNRHNSNKKVEDFFRD